MNSTPKHKTSGFGLSATNTTSIIDRLNNIDRLGHSRSIGNGKLGRKGTNSSDTRRGSSTTLSSTSSGSSSNGPTSLKSKGHKSSMSSSSSCATTVSRQVSASESQPQPNAMFLQNPFKYLEGRKFANVAGLKYMLPIDELELRRQADEHNLIKYLFNGLFKAPIHDILEQGANVLDVGCGGGSWILDMAREYPRSTFAGVDVSPVFPRTGIPQNVRFRTHNLISSDMRLPYAAASFDYVFMRNMSLAIPEKDWSMLCNELVRVTKSDGYVELFETDFEPKRRGPIFADWNNRVMFTLRARGFNPRLAPNLEEPFKNQLLDVKKCFFSLPMGTWGGRTGTAAREMWSSYLHSFQPIMAVAMGVSNDKYNKLCEEALSEMDTLDTYSNVYNVVGRRPQTCEEANPNSVAAAMTPVGSEKSNSRLKVTDDFDGVGSCAANMSRSTVSSSR